MPVLSLMWMGTISDLPKDIQEAKNAKFGLRARLALEDAVEKLKTLEPKWLGHGA